MKQEERANTHAMFDTNAHEHLDGLIQWATKKGYPDSSLNLVGCRDGRWFIEVDFGRKFDGIEGISKPYQTPYVTPTFFPNDDDARAFAYKAIKRVHPEVIGVNLDEYWDED
ncbi:hypothetical protein E2P84_41310 [Burkholderia cepacia]|uniref:Uncharacterized protein n=1 Tax=Burkholderia cepacia TaxID=292 RepID=A0AAX2RAB4_BURCE|nr:hypothetical protein [Burkholderia cepacia]MDN7901475.1 hypothetical protein [Burkholderia cepacia]TES62576.1 hypothetical protein E2P84_41310 [Burkholderia cepacia]TES95733.1 hypothetical protein E3D36_37745 [Burkholderia cepacia]TEU31696.1 hypothetical protein E3D37_44465 [Burkholderia cepacia]TEU34099.1 hypothetical protein E3D38_43730 [Burkholderia cepacia]